MVALGAGLVLAVSLLALVSSPAVGGVNSDGSADLVFAAYSEDPVPLFDQSCLGDGAGGFTCTDFNSNDPSQGMAVGDVDGDGDVDVVLTNDSGLDRVCFNDGSGAYPTCSDIGASSSASFDAELGDVDGDGDLDAIVATFGRNRVCTNDGTGNFSACTDMDTVRTSSFTVAVGYLDGDSNLDAVFSNDWDDDGHRVCLGNGAGAFTCSDVADPLLVGSTFSSVRLGYVDADAHLDAVFADNDLNHVCFGNGAGNFVDPCDTVDTVTQNADDVALDDFNEDGHLDAAFAVNGGGNRICLGDSTGSFACTDLAAGSGWVRAVDSGDVNSDGHADLVFVDADGPDQVCLGDGSGSFACSNVSSASLQTTDVAIVPADCPTLTGKATSDWGGTGTGTSKLVYDGVKMNVDFETTGFTPTGENTADVFFTWHFPTGDVDIVEHSTTTFMGGHNTAFDSTIEVLDGGTGEWVWSGISDIKKGEAKIKKIEGSLCLSG